MFIYGEGLLHWCAEYEHESTMPLHGDSYIVKLEVAGRATRLWVGLSGFWILEEAEIFSFSKSSRLVLGPTQPCIQWVRGLFPMGTAASTLLASLTSICCHVNLVSFTPGLLYPWVQEPPSSHETGGWISWLGEKERICIFVHYCTFG